MCYSLPVATELRSRHVNWRKRFLSEHVTYVIHGLLLVLHLEDRHDVLARLSTFSCRTMLSSHSSYNEYESIETRYTWSR